MCKIERIKGFNQQEKKLKKHYEETNTYKLILGHIKNSYSISDLKVNPLSKIYGFEELKYELSGYYSFNLCKNGGTIRLIIRLNEEANAVELVYISMDHYNDFKRIKKNYK